MFDIQENLKKLPDCPGVYLHKDKLGQVIYVGKAISLKKRVRQYFQSYGKSTPRLRALVENIAEFEYITCATEMEALILECNLIKKYMPKYNVLLRDDKTYPYIVVTVGEDYPQIKKTRIVKKDGSKYFGPYSDAGAVNDIVELLNNIYSLKRCSMSSFPANHRPCLNYHINQCRGICTGKVSKDEYRKEIDKAVEFLSGHERNLIRYLEGEMEKASEELRFEDAAKYRDYIISAKALSETQRVSMVSAGDMDVVIPVKDLRSSFVVLFTVRDGKLTGRETFDFQSSESDEKTELTAEFIKQYYSRWAEIPREIAVEKLPEETELLEEFLGSFGHKIRIFVPQKGDKKAILTMAQNDVKEMLKTISEKSKLADEKKTMLREEIKKVLEDAGVCKEPGSIAYNADGSLELISRSEYRIESYDISNTNGVDSVGAMVVFEGMRKIRKDYRRFKIKTVIGPDDYASLAEMLTRRFKRAKAGDTGFRVLPDAIFMDGGLGQVSIASRVLDELGIDVPVVGLAKDDKHRTRAIVFEDGREIELKNYPVLFRYAGTIQEEVHRFAIEYHRNLRNRNSITSVLDKICGVGPTRRNALLAKFDSVDAIKKASIEELMTVPGITLSVAENIVKFFEGK